MLDDIQRLMALKSSWDRVQGAVTEALTEEQRAWVAQYISEGGWGADQFLSSDRFKKLVGSFLEEYREFLSTGK